MSNSMLATICVCGVFIFMFLYFDREKTQIEQTVAKVEYQVKEINQTKEVLKKEIPCTLEYAKQISVAKEEALLNQIADKKRYESDLKRAQDFFLKKMENLDLSGLPLIPKSEIFLGYAYNYELVPENDRDFGCLLRLKETKKEVIKVEVNENDWQIIARYLLNKINGFPFEDEDNSIDSGYPGYEIRKLLTRPDLNFKVVQYPRGSLTLYFRHFLMVTIINEKAINNIGTAFLPHLPEMLHLTGEFSIKKILPKFWLASLEDMEKLESSVKSYDNLPPRIVEVPKPLVIGAPDSVDKGSPAPLIPPQNEQPEPMKIGPLPEGYPSPLIPTPTSFVPSFKENYFEKNNKFYEGWFLRRWIDAGRGQSGNDLLIVYRFWMYKIANQLKMSQADAWKKELNEQLKKAKMIDVKWYQEQLKQ